MGKHIYAPGWENWRNPENEKTARYAEFDNTGEGSSLAGRVNWSHKLTKKEALKYTIENIFKNCSDWYPFK
jgi:pectinesterase